MTPYYVDMIQRKRAVDKKSPKTTISNYKKDLLDWELDGGTNSSYGVSDETMRLFFSSSSMLVLYTRQPQKCSSADKVDSFPAYNAYEPAEHMLASVHHSDQSRDTGLRGP